MFRSRDLVAALVVVAVPTFATIFSVDVNGWAAGPKWLLAGVWMVAAIVIVADGITRDRRVDDLTEAAIERQRRFREDAVDTALRGVFEFKRQFPQKWSWTVYVYNEGDAMLEPVWPVPNDDGYREIVSFAPGSGATGLAWQDNVTVSRYGESVHDATYGLTEAQQTHFAVRNNVVATPIYTEYETPVGVLAAVAADENRHFEDEAHRRQLEATATVVGTLLTSLLPDRL